MFLVLDSSSQGHASSIAAPMQTVRFWELYNETKKKTSSLKVLFRIVFNEINYHVLVQANTVLQDPRRFKVGACDADISVESTW